MESFLVCVCHFVRIPEHTKSLLLNYLYSKHMVELEFVTIKKKGYFERYCSANWTPLVFTVGKDFPKYCKTSFSEELCNDRKKSSLIFFYALLYSRIFISFLKKNVELTRWSNWISRHRSKYDRYFYLRWKNFLRANWK